MTLLAYDRIGSVRTFDEDGRLRVETTPISKANICEYPGAEIPNGQALGLSPEKRYRLLRDPDELRKAVDTFNALPVLEDHTPTSASAHPRELTVGSTMNNASFEAPYLKVGMAIFDGPMIDKIKSGEQREISCGYKYTADMTSGTYDNEPYDGRMTNIRGNHVALVEKGRAGPDVLVYDTAKGHISVDPDNKTPTCDNEQGLTDVVEALRPFMGDLSDDAIRAKAADLIAQGDNQTSKPGGNHEEEPLPKTPGQDNETEQPDDRLAKMEAFMREEGFTPAQVSKCRDMCADMLNGGATDEGADTTPNSGTPLTSKDEEEKPKKEAEDEEAKKQATDAAIQRAIGAERSRMRNVETAKQAVRPLVGEVHGMDSADQVYRYALTQHSGMTFDRLRGINTAGLKALVEAQKRAAHPTPSALIANDSASLPFTPPRQLG